MTLSRLSEDKDLMFLYIKMSVTESVWEHIKRPSSQYTKVIHYGDISYDEVNLSQFPKSIRKILNKQDEYWTWKDLTKVCMHFGIIPRIEMRSIKDEQARLRGLVETQGC